MNITKIYKDQYPFLLRQIPKPPESMDMIGSLPPDTYKYLCIVGSRAFSPYGQEACEKLIAGLSGYPIVIVSGLANGIDAIAHEAALKAGLLTVAFPGSGLLPHVLYPASQRPLAGRIIDAGGALLSPFKSDQKADTWTFPTRNTLMAGISHVTLIIEAREKSGTLITAAEAGKLNRDVLAVPGSIFSDLSFGPHAHIRDGAVAVTSSADILEALSLDHSAYQMAGSLFSDSVFRSGALSQRLSDDEKMILDHLKAHISRDDLIRAIDKPAGYVNSVLIELELKGVVTERQGLLMAN